MKDEIGNRLKTLWETPETSRKVQRESPIYARIDGRCFSKFTTGLKRPFDTDFSDVMLTTTRRLMEETGAVLGYTQSDEISLAWYNKAETSQHIFDGKFQKMCSVLAGIATSEFTLQGLARFPEAIRGNPPVFDARVFPLPDLAETANCFVWRCLDARKNSISQLARHHFRASVMQGKGGAELCEMLRRIGVEWKDLESRFRFGTFVRPEARMVELPDEVWNKIPEKHRPESRLASRTVFVDYSFDYSLHENKVKFLSGESAI